MIPLTPVEMRTIEKEIANIRNLSGYIGHQPRIEIVITLANCEFWLKIFDMAKFGNEVAKERWDGR